MVSKYKARVPSDSITVSSVIYARAVIAAARRGLNVGRWVEEAIHEKDASESHERIAIAYRDECMLAADERRPSPDKAEFLAKHGM